MLKITRRYQAKDKETTGYRQQVGSSLWGKMETPEYVK